jgi:DNA-binding response OmpR family regulator
MIIFAYRRQNMNILVCDDDKEIVEAIEAYLKSEGYNIIKCYTGKQAIEIVESKDVHLIIMDIMMPEMNGIMATTKIREIKNIPVIMLSAKSEETDIILGLNMGADDYITKPFNPLELIARVKQEA